MREGTSKLSMYQTSIKGLITMAISEHDFEEAGDLVELIKKIDGMDPDYVNTVSDEIFTKQPFLLSVLLGYQFDLTLTQMEEVMRVYFLMWEYFKRKGKLPVRKVTEDLFEQVQRKNLKMLKYAEGEPTDKDRQEIYDNDIENIKSKALLAAVFLRFNERPELVAMDIEKRGPVLIGIKSFIECLETI
jgi:hypothetical protein